MADFEVAGLRRDISSLGKQISELTIKVNSVQSNMSSMSSQVDSMKKDLEALRKDFRLMMEEQRRATALEQAATELVSVRQEMEKNFGNYGAVRKTMVGILQATDAALVRKATISTVSEELMISTPDYWLAPVLVAVAAWINNNRDLAERAIEEAMKRDKEHTSLAMALICRRNNRRSTCYEWLARYFATQNAARIDADSMVYIDAYINGVFGPDEKHLCDDYLGRWINQVKYTTSDFEDKQTQSWAEYFQNYVVESKTHFPALANIVDEFDYIESYLQRLDRIGDIQSKFEGMRSLNVDKDAIAAQIDQHLMTLVESDDKNERKLRSKEEYLLAVKACEGDVKRAREMVDRHRTEKIRNTMNIIEQMNKTVREQGSKADQYKKKSALRFLSPYINGGYSKYLEQSAMEFPSEITVHLQDWSHKATGSDQLGVLSDSYLNYVLELKNQEIADLDKKIAESQKSKRTLGVILLVVAAILFFILPAVGFILVAVGLITLLTANKGADKRDAQATEIAQKYKAQYEDGTETLEIVLDEWEQAKQAAQDKQKLLEIEKVA